MKIFVKTVMIVGVLCIGSKAFSQNCNTLFNDNHNALLAREAVNSKFLIDKNINRRFVGSVKYPGPTKTLGNDVIVYNEDSKTIVQIRTLSGQSKAFEVLDDQVISLADNEIKITNKDGVTLTVAQLQTTSNGSLLLVTISDVNSLSALILTQ